MKDLRLSEEILRKKARLILSRINLYPEHAEQEIYQLCKDLDETRQDNLWLLDECLRKMDELSADVKKLENKNETPKLSPNDSDIDGLY